MPPKYIETRVWLDQIRPGQSCRFEFSPEPDHGAMTIRCLTCAEDPVIGTIATTETGWKAANDAGTTNAGDSLEQTAAGLCVQHLDQTELRQQANAAIRQFLGLDEEYSGRPLVLPPQTELALREAAKRNRAPTRRSKMTTPYSPHGQTIEDIMTDSVGRQNGLNDEDWLSVIEQWQQANYDNPEEPAWFRIRPATGEYPVDIEVRTYRGGWLFMAAFQGADHPDYPPDEYEEEAYEDNSRPMVGRAVIHMPALPGFDEGDYE